MAGMKKMMGKLRGMKKKAVRGMKKVAFHRNRMMGGGGGGSSDAKNPINYIRSLGHNIVTSLTGQTTTTLTIPTSPHNADSEDFCAIIAVMFYGTTGTCTCADSLGNTYTQVAEVTFNTNYQIDLFVAPGINSMAKNAVVTVTHPSSTRRIIMGDEFRDVAAEDFDDVTAAAHNSVAATFATSGMTSVTTQDRELLFGVIGVNGPSTDSLKKPSNWNLLHDRGTNASDSNDIRLITQYRLVSKTGTYEVSGTLGTARLWGAITQALKADGGNSDITKD